MIRKLLATTAILTIVSTGAFAQTTAPTTEPAPATPPAATEAAPAAPMAPGVAVDQSEVTADGQLASNLIGENVYNSTAEDAEKVGDVNDLVLSKDGMVEAIVIGVGGFLGIGEKDVAIDFKTIDWAERDGDRWIVIEATADQLKELPDFDRGAYAPAPAVASNDSATPPATTTPSTDMSQNNAATPPAATDSTAEAPAASGTDKAAEAPADADATKADKTAEAPAASDTETKAEAPAASGTDTTAQAPAATDQTATAAIDRSKLKELNTAEIRSEDLVGTTVYGANDENIGEIGDVVLQNEKVDAVIIDVGGFLGVGEKEVAVGMDNLTFMADEDGDRYLYTTFTKEQLDAAPAYDESAYAEKRDEMRIMPN
ncbi:MAG: PRC-barrel domain-containing protein [Mesorhizobium sp.]|nr:PRC-barrel domain-containing protein [Mesorhizobium sp.]